jgi:thiamine kinase-like enzyme
MDQHLERIFAQVPGWHINDAVITPLVGGITNQNYRVDINGKAFVLRIGGKGTQLLGIDRKREYACTAIAAQIGVGAEVIYFLASEDALVTRFIEGQGISPEKAGQPEMLPRIVESMKRYHAGPTFSSTFSPFAVVRDYHELALQYGVTFPDTLARVFTLMDQIENALAGQHVIKPCHNDLLASNFIDDGQTIWILDWEYAGMGDIFFDLGNFAVNQELSDEQCMMLLRCYFGAVRAADLAHLHLMRLASDLRESFWGFLQLALSELDFDYAGYAHSHLQRFLSNIAVSPFSRWLDEVQQL